MKNTISGFFGMILIFSFLSTTSCRNVIKSGSKQVTKSLVKKAAKYFLGAAFLISVEELVASDMLDLFETEPANKESGTATIYNTYTENITIQITNNGFQWQEKALNSKESIKFHSNDQGLIFISSEQGGYYMLQPNKEYAVTRNGGKTIVKEIERAE